MQIQPHVRPFIKSMVRDGLQVNVREDHWLSCGQLLKFISYHFIYSHGFSTATKVNELMMALLNGFSNDWIHRFPALHGVSFPVLRYGGVDTLAWASRSEAIPHIS
ncbi:hypothetical protein OSB04_un001044 [Centaurea solstitialis]|uniref:Uncharacterized protein n=1 Tax=Centaurea solstitialis TaxID=347529 RepID=A0AA38W300_9ASTR|nr:hypothetical protein OSB04_un001044 [Centaurea solstitialis]